MKDRSGFTLIEVLVALAIFAIGITATLRAIGVAAGGLEDERNRLLAGWVAQNRLGAILATRAFPAVGNNEGQEEMGGQTWYWREETKATQNPLFHRVDVKVFAGPQDTHAMAQLSGFAVKPLKW